MVVWPREAADGTVTCEKKVTVPKTEIRSSSYEIPTKIWKRLHLTAGDVLHVVIKEDKEFGTTMYNEMAESMAKENRLANNSFADTSSDTHTQQILHLCVSFPVNSLTLKTAGRSSECHYE